MLKFIESPKTRGMTSKKTIAFPEENKQFCRWFRANMDAKRLIWFDLQRDGTRNGLSNIKETFCRKFAAKNVSFLHQSMSIFKGWSLKFIWWLGKVKVKKKYPMRQIPIKMSKQHATPNSCLHNSKIYSSKGQRKTSQRWIYVASYLPS